MKKTLLAAALVTGFAGVAHAESSVTLYGVVDGGYGFAQEKVEVSGEGLNGEYKNNSIGFHSGVQNGSRWGLKGSEDLGNGTSAIFTLESGFDLGDGTSGQSGRLFGRQAYVGLTGDSWGTFTIGRQYNAGDTFVAPIDPFGTGWNFAGVENVFGGSVSARYDNTLKYVTPNFGGFQAGLGVVYQNEDKKFEGAYTLGLPNYEIEKTTTGVTFGLGYTGGALYVGGTFDYLEEENKHSLSGDTESKTKAWNIGATYDFDVVKLHAMYGGQKDGSIGGGPDLSAFGVNNSLDYVGSDAFYGDGYSQHSWMLGLSAPVGDAGKVMFSYAGSIADNDIGATEWEATSHNFALGYRHALSKRTSLYGVASYGWSDLDNDRNNIEFETTRTQAIIGLQHRF